MAATTSSRQWRRRLLSLAVGVVLGSGLWVGLTTADQSGPQTAAAFSLARLGGGPRVTLPVAGHRRVPVVLTFFASWCTPCRTELPMVASVASHAQRSGGRVVFLGIDGNDDPSSGLALARASGVSFPVGIDPTSDVAPRYGLVGYPDTVLVDDTGTIAATVRGPISRATLDRWVGSSG